MSDRSTTRPATGPLTYGPAGATRPAEERWSAEGTGLRPFSCTVVIGHGDADWRAAADAVLHWGVKRRSGFAVMACGSAGEQVAAGAEYRITAGFGPFAVREPVRVVAVVDRPDRCGFAYGTLPGHPVCGEEAFVVHRSADGTVALTIRSLTRAAPHGPWRILFPALLLAQRFFRRRYRRALMAPL
ncbi:DUF1990 family protein [Actinacidiphila glaucinigra]|uniref:Uncharacterized protein, UPF0548 family n=1 Tax=Actinacidiphila glaucinigra TaxID=235986 RepID=A0A239MYY5_9ACTN|nr:DUF1990 domain-containing protein [Actinacidiphila glaucinigra]SNT47941.1 Uncharacterized protein, UPF0548 family [Actinacidiphila glaucinigra]